MCLREHPISACTPGRLGESGIYICTWYHMTLPVLPISACTPGRPGESGTDIYVHDITWLPALPISPCTPGWPRECECCMWSHDTACLTYITLRSRMTRGKWDICTWEHMTVPALPISSCAPRWPSECECCMWSQDIASPHWALPVDQGKVGGCVWFADPAVPSIHGFMGFPHILHCIISCGLLSFTPHTSAHLVRLCHCNPKSGLAHFFIPHCLITLLSLLPFETASLRVPEDLWLKNMKGHSHQALQKVQEAQNARSQFLWSASLPPLHVNSIFSVCMTLIVCRFMHLSTNGMMGFTKRRLSFGQKHMRTSIMATSCSFR